MFYESNVSSGSAASLKYNDLTSARRTFRVMIVEDEALIAWDMRTLVEGFGWSVCGIAPSGADAVRMAREKRPDVVLMDVRLRGEMDGVEASRDIAAGQQVPIIFITGNSDQATEARIRAIHPNAPILSKPVVPAVLRNTMMALLAAS